MMDWLKKLVVAVLGLFGLSTLLSAKKTKEVKEIKKDIISNINSEVEFW